MLNGDFQDEGLKFVVVRRIDSSHRLSYLSVSLFSLNINSDKNHNKSQRWRQVLAVIVVICFLSSYLIVFIVLKIRMK